MHGMMTKIALVAAVLAATGLHGEARAQVREQIRVVGSSTVFPFTTTVAERFGRNTVFRTPVIEATGTGGGIRLLCSGIGARHPDIANASRRIKPSELADCEAAGIAGVTEVKIGYDGIVLASSRASEPIDVTREQLYLALARQVPQDGAIVENPYRRWSDIDPSLPDSLIQVYGPPPTSGTRDAFVELVMEEGCAAFEEVRALPEEEREAVCAQLREDGAFVEAGENDNLIVQRLSANPDAFGIFGYSFLEQNADVLQGAAIGGVEPSFENIAEGHYPVARSLYLYVKKPHVGPIPGIEDFLAELVSDAAMGEEGYLADKGLIPLPDEELALVRERVRALEPLRSADLRS